MRALSLLAALLLVSGIFCGGAEEAPVAEQPTEQPAAAGEFPADAFAVITEAEMATFIKALPGVGEALEAAEYSPEEQEGADIATGLSTMVEGIKVVDGVEAALKAAGTDWAQFRSTLYKVMTATAAFGVEMASAMAEELGGDSPEAKEAMAELEKAKEFTSQVPQENKDMVIQHMDDLDPLEALGN